MPGPNYNSFHASFYNLATTARLTVTDNPRDSQTLNDQLISFVKMHKFASGAQGAKSVVAGEPITSEDVTSALDYLQTNISNNVPNYGYIKDLEENFSTQIRNFNVSDLDGITHKEAENISDLRDKSMPLLNGLHNRGYLDSSTETRISGRLTTMENFGRIAATKNSPDMSADARAAADVTYNMFKSTIEGKTIGEVNAMYPTQEGLSYTQRVFNALLRLNRDDGKLAESRGPLSENGFVTVDAKSEEFVAKYNDRMKAVEQSLDYKLSETEKLTPAIIYSEGVPDFSAAVNRIVNDAKKSFAEHYSESSLLRIGAGGVRTTTVKLESLNDEEKAMVESYGKIVEGQVTRLLLSNGYETKCRNALFADDLKNDIEYFANNENSKTLPYFLDQKMVQSALDTALQATIAGHPENQRLQKMESDIRYYVNEDLQYSEERTVLPAKNMEVMTPSSYTPSAKLNNDIRKTVNEISNKFEPYNEGKKVIGLYSESEVGDNAIPWKNTAAKLTFTSDKIDDIKTTANLFDTLLVGKNEQLKKTMENADVKKQTGTYKNAEGKEVGDATKLCYIGGESVDNYIQSKLGMINRWRYNRLSEEEKVDYRKAAVVKAVLEGGNQVDVKTYVQKSDMSVEAFVSTITENADKYNAKIASQEDIVKDTKAVVQANEKRTNKIKEADTLGAEMNAQIEVKKQEIRLKRENQLKIERNMANARERKLNAQQEIQNDKKVEVSADTARKQVTVDLGDKKTTTFSKDPKSAEKKAPTAGPKMGGN